MPSRKKKATPENVAKILADVAKRAPVNPRDRVVELRRVRAADLLPNPENWRRHPEAQRQAVRGVLREIGYADALLARETPAGLVLLDGHLRRELTPDETVPVLVIDLDDAEAAKLLATLDPLAAMAETDGAALKALLAKVTTEDEALVSFFARLGKAGGGSTGGLSDPDDVPSAETAISCVGDLWMLGGHRLLCGDATAAEAFDALLRGAVADLAVTSPPYNQKINTFRPSGMHREGQWVEKVGALAYPDAKPEADYQATQLVVLRNVHRVLRDGRSLFYNHKNRYREKIVVSPLEWLPGPFALRQEIVWSRPGSVTQNARMFLPSDERIYWLYKGGDFLFEDTTEIKSWSTVWRLGLETNLSHAVAFPVELPTRCIRAASRTGEVVLEPYCGSGTTMIAAQMTGRNCFGMELESRYVDVAVKRWEAFTGEQATLEATGQTFAEVTAERSHGTEDQAHA